MRLQKRAFLAAIRRKKTSATLLLIFFLLSMTLLIGMSIFRSIQQAIVDVRKTYATSFTIELSLGAVPAHTEDRDPSDPYYAFSTQVYRGERVTPDVVEAIASTEGIESYDVFDEVYVVRSDDLELIPGMWREPETLKDADDEEIKAIISEQYTPYFVTHNDSALASEFRTNAFELVEGRHITPEDTHAVLMSDELAEKNHVEVGSTFHVYFDTDFYSGIYDGYDGSECDGYECDLTVVGIFHINATQIITEYTAEQSIAANKLFLDVNTNYEYHEYQANNGVTEPYYFQTATFFVDDPAELDTVMERALARDDVDWSCLEMTYDDTTYQSAIEPLQKLQKIVLVCLVVLICVMVVLLYLVLQMSIQGRTSELNIYHVLGIRKRAVFGQLMLECILLALLAFIPASAITAVGANSLGNAALSLSQRTQESVAELSDAEILESIQNGTFDELTGIQMDAAPQEIVVSLSPAVMALVLAVLLLLVAIFVLWHLRDYFAPTLPGRQRVSASDVVLRRMKPSKLSHRAALYILRERRKSLRLGAVVLVFAVFLTICSTVYRSTENSLMEVRKTIDVSFRVNSVTDDNLVVDDAFIEDVMSLGGLKAYDGENVTTLYSEEFDLIPGYFASDSSYDEYLQHVMRIRSHHNSELAQDFVYGYLELAEGRHLEATDIHSAMISTDLAELNGLSVGDTITVQYTPNVVEEETRLQNSSFSFTIVGLFDITGEGQSDSLQAESEMRENTIYIDAQSGHELNYSDPDSTTYRYGATFWLDDPKDAEELIAQVEELSDDITITVNDKAYQESIEPLERVSSLMQILFIALTIASICILSLILYLWTKQRIHEIGIYLSLGIQKGEIRKQFLLESLSIAIAACVVSIPVTLLAVFAAGKVIGSIGFPSVVVFCGIFLLLLVIVILATVIASRPLLKMHPRQIFTQLS